MCVCDSVYVCPPCFLDNNLPEISFMDELPTVCYVFCTTVLAVLLQKGANYQFVFSIFVHEKEWKTVASFESRSVSSPIPLSRTIVLIGTRYNFTSTQNINVNL